MTLRLRTGMLAGVLEAYNHGGTITVMGWRPVMKDARVTWLNYDITFLLVP